MDKHFNQSLDRLLALSPRYVMVTCLTLGDKQCLGRGRWDVGNKVWGGGGVGGAKRPGEERRGEGRGAGPVGK